MIAVQPNNELQEGQLLYANGCLVAEGFDLETATYNILGSHARAAPGDLLPEGTNRRGWWGDAFDPDGEQLGSLLWLLEDAVASPENAQRAEKYALDALKVLMDRGHVRATSAQSEIVGDSIYLGIVHTLPNGQTVTLSPFKVT